MVDASSIALRQATPWVYIVVMSLIVELLHSDAQPPRRATAGSAGYDLCAYLRGRTVKCSDGLRTWEAPVAGDGAESSFVLQRGVTVLIPLGFKAKVPDGIEAQIRPRSGTTFKKGLQIPNAPGTIDSDYPDEWMVIVRNPTEAPVHIAHGERIAQMVLARYEVLEVVTGSVSVTTTRIGGFGSTGG
jgi:dUTP pyrophosphatase